ncbi:hypothetical protein IEO21_03959 [Rhodonia placenta]|uniref:F-box domain-containing protein n=1 Tax=Rhodonia placenta TaxID=104341 RepID=A0A8H7P4X9_9APHY|nr:hypothetical protein IEO21_03959 [Postia placenta]
MSSCISRLPVELLTDIFAHVSSPFVDRRRNAEREVVWPTLFGLKDATALFPLMHVCRHWRTVALQSPSLWTTLHGRMHLSKADEYLARSQGMALHVVNFPHGRLDIEHLCQISGSRVRSLFYDRSYDHKCLELGDHNIDTFGISSAYSLYTIPPPLPLKSTTGLKVLVLNHIMWLPENSFSNLTHLFVANIQVRTSQLLELLASTPKLTDLGLYNLHVDLQARSSEGLGLPVANLAHLRRLSVGKRTKFHLPRLFSQMTVPSLSAASFDGCDPMSIIAPLSRLLIGVEFTAIRVSSSSAEMAVVATCQSSAVRFSRYHNRRSEPWSAELLEQLPGRETIRELWLDHEYAIGRGDLGCLLRSLPGLTRLYTNASQLQHLHDWLSNSEDPIYCPNLTTLYLMWKRDFPDRIFDIVGDRARLCCPLKEVVIHQRGPSSEGDWRDHALEALQPYVETIRFIGPDGKAPMIAVPDACIDGNPSPYFWPKDWVSNRFYERCCEADRHTDVRSTRASRRTLLRKLYPVIGLADPTNKVEMDIYADFTLSDVFTSWVSYSR